MDKLLANYPSVKGLEIGLTDDKKYLVIHKNDQQYPKVVLEQGNYLVRSATDVISQIDPYSLEAQYDAMSDLEQRYTAQDYIYTGERFAPEGCPLKTEPSDHSWARFVLSMHDVPASLTFAIEEHTAKFTLFCMYEGVKHKVIRASSMGDVFINENLKADSYSKRVPITQLYGFSKE